MLASHQNDPIDRIADLIRCYSSVASDACSEVLEDLKIQTNFNLLMAETMAFFFSIALSELMMRRGGASKEDYQQIEREIRKALSKLGLQYKEFFLFAMFPTDDRFKEDVLRYYRGCMADFGLSDSKVREFAQKYHLKTPPDNCFEMAIFIFYLQIVHNCRLDSHIGNAGAEYIVARKLIELLGNDITDFLDSVRDGLKASS